MERNFVNVILLGFGFMFLFTAFQTMGNIEVRRARSDGQNETTTVSKCAYACVFFKSKFIEMFFLNSQNWQNNYLGIAFFLLENNLWSCSLSPYSDSSGS